MPFNYTEQKSNGHELVEVEQGIKTDPDECCGNREVPRQWVVFPGGMLNEFKPEHSGVVKEFKPEHNGVLKKVKPEHNAVLKNVKSEHDGHTLNREVARSWVVCPSGVLKEIKTEHTE